jgi:hypothetical protein
LWISGITTNIHGYNRAGDHNQEHEISSHRLRIYGLAYYPEDEAPLYIFSRPGVDRRVIHKINPENDDRLFVCDMEFDIGGIPAGCFITDQFDECRSWSFINIANDGADERIDIWQLKANVDWMAIEPTEGVVQPGGNQDLTLTLTLSSVELDSNLTLEGELIFSHSVGGEDTHIPVTLSIVSNAVKGDKTHIPTEFGITSLYPNPFNATTTISYSLPVASPVSLALYDLSGREVRTLKEGNQQAGVHPTIMTAADLPSGLYFVRLKASDRVFTQKITLIR